MKEESEGEEHSSQCLLEKLKNTKIMVSGEGTIFLVVFILEIIEVQNMNSKSISWELCGIIHCFEEGQ